MIVARHNSQGNYDIIDTETGTIIEKSKPSKKGTKISRGLVSRKNTKQPYTETMIKKILQYIREGETIESIGRMETMPSAAQIHLWKSQYQELIPWFRQARADRAEYYHDKAVDTADKTTNDSVRPDRLKVQVYQWAASVGNPAEYAPKPTEQGKGNITFYISTGVPHKEVEVKSEWKSEELAQDTSPESSLPKSNSTKDSSDSTS